MGWPRPVASADAPGYVVYVAWLILRGFLSGSVLTVCVACGANSSVEASGGGTSGASTGGSAGGSSNASGASNSGGSNVSGGSSVSGGGDGSQREATAGTDGGEPPAACDCGSEACATPAAEIARFCMSAGSMDLGTYTEREGCDSVVVRVDYDRGDRTYYYDHQGALVARVSDNAFAGGYSVCGMVPSCAGTILRQCRLCRGSSFKDDTVPDCPADLWQ